MTDPSCHGNKTKAIYIYAYISGIKRHILPNGWLDATEPTCFHNQNISSDFSWLSEKDPYQNHHQRIIVHHEIKGLIRVTPPNFHMIINTQHSHNLNNVSFSKTNQRHPSIRQLSRMLSNFLRYWWTHIRVFHSWIIESSIRKNFGFQTSWMSQEVRING